MAQQLSMWTQGEDLPLFSGTAQRAAVETFQPAPEVVQETWATCRACKDTGRIGRRFCNCEAGVKAWEAGRGDPVTTDAIALSSGTVAGLIGSNRYPEIKAAQAGLVGWCIDHAGEYQNWQEAWEAYKAAEV